MLLMGSEGAAEAIGSAPLARVVSRAAHGVDPDVFGIAPVEACNKALVKAGLTWEDVDAVELNEAFASQSLACLEGWPDLDPDKVNMSGGAIAIGHPLGASGARVVGRVVTELRERGGRYGVASLCIGVGQGLAMVVERV
jgi:acetyl-CoA acyltransferase